MESILLILQLLQFFFFLCQFRGNYKPKKKNPIYRLESFQVILVPGRCEWASEGNLKVENLHTVLKNKTKQNPFLHTSHLNAKTYKLTFVQYLTSNLPLSTWMLESDCQLSLWNFGHMINYKAGLSLVLLDL